MSRAIDDTSDPDDSRAHQDQPCSLVGVDVLPPRQSE